MMFLKIDRVSWMKEIRLKFSFIIFICFIRLLALPKVQGKIKIRLQCSFLDELTAEIDSELIFSSIVEFLVINWLDSWEDLSIDSWTSWFGVDESVPWSYIWWFKCPSSNPEPGAVVATENIAPTLRNTSNVIGKSDKPKCVAQVKATWIGFIRFDWSHLIMFFLWNY